MRRFLLKRFTKILEIFLLLAGVGQAARRGGFIWSIVTYLNKIVRDSQVNIFRDFIILYITYKYCKHFISSRPDNHPQAGGNSLFFPGLSIETLMNVYKIAAVIV